jgi:hypothetical protein
MAIAAFTSEGLLPPFDHTATLDEVRASYLVIGAGVNSPTWDKKWRAHLVDNLEVLVGQLWTVGIDQIFIDGSFVEEKDHPNDIDGYFECDRRAFMQGTIKDALNDLDPYKIWTWDVASRRKHRSSAKAQLPMWYRYRVELYPHLGQIGLRDEHGHDQQFPAAFRRTRGDGRPKGIVKIVKPSENKTTQTNQKAQTTT